MPDESNIGEGQIPQIDRLSELEEKANFSRVTRKLEMEGVGHKITIVILVVVVITLGIIGLLRMAHLILPHDYQWLKEEEIHKIDEFFIHGTVGALLVEFLRGKISSRRNH